MYDPKVLRFEWASESPEACSNTDCWPDPQNSWDGRSGVIPPNLHFFQVTPTHGNCAFPDHASSRVCFHALSTFSWKLRNVTLTPWEHEMPLTEHEMHLCSSRLQLMHRPHYLQNALPQAFLLLLFLLPDSTFNKSGFSPLCLQCLISPACAQT